MSSKSDANGRAVDREDDDLGGEDSNGIEPKSSTK